MYKQAALALALVTAGNLYGENIFKSLLNIRSDDLSKTNPGLAKRNLGDSPFFLYKLNGNSSSRTSTAKEDADYVRRNAVRNVPGPIRVKEVIVERVLKYPVNPDGTPYEPVISKNLKTDELGHKAHINERDALYGKDSPLRDDSVIEAWDEADAAQKRLDDHRQYMERVRKARKLKEDAKRHDIRDKN